MAVKKGYKQTEVGVIPEDWLIHGFNALACIPSGQVDPKQEPFRSMVLVAPDHIESGSGRLLKKETAAVQKAISGKYLFAPGDVLYSKIRPYLRKATIAEFAGLCSADMYPLRPSGRTCAGFLLGVILGHRFSKYAESVSVRSGMPKINRDELSTFYTAIPPTLTEQEAIAGALSDADAWIESLEQLIAKKRQIKQGAMQELLTGKRRLPGFSGKWEKCSVGDVIEKAFCGPSPTCEERNIHGEEWGVLKTTAMTWEHGWDWTKHKRLPEHYWNQPEIEVHTGDVVVTKAGPRHRVGVAAFVNYVPDRILVSGKMIGLRPNTKRALGFMLAAAISAPSSQKFLDQRTTGMAESQVNFENGVLIGTPICLPSISEQHAIGSTLSDMDAEIDSLESKLAKAREVKQGIMKELLTGRIRLV
jgi:type I restriction enzyme S subunit